MVSHQCFGGLESTVVPDSLLICLKGLLYLRQTSFGSFVGEGFVGLYSGKYTSCTCTYDVCLYSIHMYVYVCVGEPPLNTSLWLHGAEWVSAIEGIQYSPALCTV